MYSLNETSRLVARNTNFYNKRKTTPTAKTSICIISKVNEQRLTVDVTIPSTATQITNVTIATNLISDNGTGVLVLPSVGQKGLLMMSSQHPAILIATLPNQSSDNRKNTLLSDEVKIGGKDSFIKLAKNKSLSLKTTSSSLILDKECQKIIASAKTFKGYGVENDSSYDKETGVGYSREVFFKTLKNDYFINKEDILNDGHINSSVKDNILKSNLSLLDKFNSLIYRVEEVNNNIELGSMESIDALNELRNDIVSLYTFSDYSNKVSLEKGCTEYNKANNSLFSAILFKDDEENSSISMLKDGTIKITCNDFIVERKE